MNNINSSVQTPIVAEYFGIFDKDWDQCLRNETPLNTFNRLYIAFAKIIQNTNNQFTIAIDGDDTRVCELVNRVKAVNPSTELMLTLGGDGELTSFLGAAYDPNFAQYVYDVLKKYQLIGLDIDWEEGLLEGPLNALTTNLSKMLKPNGFKLTLDGWENPDPSYNMQVLSQNLDQINIMSYGKDCDLSYCVNAYTNLGFPINKLIGAIETEVDYDGGVDTLGPEGTIAQKALYALTNNMAGMTSWCYNHDYKSGGVPNSPTYQGGIALWNAMQSVRK